MSTTKEQSTIIQPVTLATCSPKAASTTFLDAADGKDQICSYIEGESVQDCSEILQHLQKTFQSQPDVHRHTWTRIVVDQLDSLLAEHVEVHQASRWYFEPETDEKGVILNTGSDEMCEFTTLNSCLFDRSVQSCFHLLMCIKPEVPITTPAAARLMNSLTKAVVHHLSSTQIDMRLGEFVYVLQTYFPVDRESHMDMLNAILDGVADPLAHDQQTRLDFFRDLVDLPSHPIIGAALGKLNQLFSHPRLHQDLVSTTIAEIRMLTRDEPIRWITRERFPSPWLLNKSRRPQDPKQIDHRLYRSEEESR